MSLSPRLAEIVAALPITPHARVLEIGCGPGAAARAVAAQLTTGHILAIDRSAKAIAEASGASAEEIASGRMSVRQVAAEDFVLAPDEPPFDIVFAVRVDALDGRHPEAGRRALARITAALAPGGRIFVDGHESAAEPAVLHTPDERAQRRGSQLRAVCLFAVPQRRQIMPHFNTGTA